MFLLTRTTSHRANLGRQIWKFLYMQAKANENRKKITKTLQQHPSLCDYTARSRSSGAAQAGIWERRGWDVALRTWCGAGTLQVRSVAGHGDLHCPFQPRWFCDRMICIHSNASCTSSRHDGRGFKARNKAPFVSLYCHVPTQTLF